MDEEREQETIGMLLDIDHLYGEHEGRMGPLILTLVIIAAPVLFYIYFGLYSVIPIWLFCIFEAFLVIRAFMKIMGREKYRVKLYKKQINDDYMSTADMLNIKTIHPDGCIEYINGTICYLVSCFNGTTEDDIQRSIQLRKFLETMLSDYSYDTYILNINEAPALRDYYNRVSNFDKNISARNFINIIDHNIKLTEDTSMVQCTVYAIQGYRSDWKNIKSQIDVALGSNTARCYKSATRISDPEIINELLNRDVDSVINISELLRRKYATQQYDTSKVLAYDLPDDKEIVQGRSNVDPVVADVAPKGSFHIKYKGD